MAFFFVSDGGDNNFPTDENDLKARLAKIAEGLSDQGDNVKPFVIPAFKLFKDCGLITKENIEILSRKSLVWTEKNSWGRMVQRELDMNPFGGVLRREDLSMYDDGGYRRYYYDGRDTIFIVFEGVRYYISNDWFSPSKPRPTKLVFYNWLEKKAWAACKAKWEKDKKNPPTPPKVSDNPETEKLLRNLISLVASLDSRVDNLENILGKMGNDIEEIKNMWK